MSLDQSIQYVIVQEDTTDASNGGVGIQREELEGAIEALAQQSNLLRQRDGGSGLSSGGPQQFQIVKDDGKGGTTTTTIVLVDEGSAGGNINLQNLKSSSDTIPTTSSSNTTRQDTVSILPERSITEGNNYVTNDDLIAMALGESGVTTISTDSATSTVATVTSVSGTGHVSRTATYSNTNTAPTFRRHILGRTTEAGGSASSQIIVSGNEGVVVPTDFDDKAVYVIDGPDGISQVVASAEEFQKLVGEATTNDVMVESEKVETRQETNENLSIEAEEMEEEIPPRKRLRLEKKLRNSEFLFRRRKRDICAKMRQYESEMNKITRQNNSLQQQLNGKLTQFQKVEEQINAFKLVIAKAKGLPVYEATKSSAA